MLKLVVKYIDIKLSFTSIDSEENEGIAIRGFIPLDQISIPADFTAESLYNFQVGGVPCEYDIGRF